MKRPDLNVSAPPRTPHAALALTKAATEGPQRHAGSNTPSKSDPAALRHEQHALAIAKKSSARLNQTLTNLSCCCSIQMDRRRRYGFARLIRAAPTYARKAVPACRANGFGPRSEKNLSCRVAGVQRSRDPECRGREIQRRGARRSVRRTSRDGCEQFGLRSIRISLDCPIVEGRLT